MEETDVVIKTTNQKGAVGVVGRDGDRGSAVAPRYADEHSKCQHAIEKAESNLDHAIHKHGEHSPEADSRRRELNDERQHCWDTYHGWWDGHAHVWHTDRDWDHP